MKSFHSRGWDTAAPSIWKLFAEHRKAASRLLPGRLVLNHVPVLCRHPVLHSHDVADDPCRPMSKTAETSVKDNESTGGSGNVVFIMQRVGQSLCKIKEPVTARRNMGAVLDVAWGPEALRSGINRVY